MWASSMPLDEATPQAASSQVARAACWRRFKNKTHPSYFLRLLIEKPTAPYQRTRQGTHHRW
jgi:hypothetical protein